MPTIRELLETQPKEITNDLSIIFGHSYNHVPEIDGDIEGAAFRYGQLKSTRADIATFHYQYHDSRRFQSLYGVRLDGKYVMICQNAGREGDDWRRRYIIDATLYLELVKHLKALLVMNTKLDEVEVTGLDTDIPTLYQFYGEDVRQTYMRW